MGSGQYVVADALTNQVPVGARPTSLNLVRSRIEMQSGNYEAAVALSQSVLAAVAVGSLESAHALLNLITTHMHLGNDHDVLRLSEELRRSSSSDQLSDIADGMRVLVAASGTGSIVALATHLTGMAERQRGAHPHYFGVTMLNLAAAHTALDDPMKALACASQSVEAFAETASLVETSSSLMAKATALTLLGNASQARIEMERALDLGQAEALVEEAELADSFIDPDAAPDLLETIQGRGDLNLNDQAAFALQSARSLARRGRHAEAAFRLLEVDPNRIGTDLCQATILSVTRAYLAVASRSDDQATLISEALSAAKQQGATRWLRIAQLLRGVCGSGHEASEAVASFGRVSPWNVTYLADLVVRRLDEFDDEALAVVRNAAALHPGRWRFVLRQSVDGAASGAGINAARLLEDIGEQGDVRRLRSFARRQRRGISSATIGRELARRLADRVFVEDQQRVAIHVGARQLSGSTIRRKVLALLCFLFTKPEMASTRDQVLDALWPDLDPLDAVNSLNQTVYFLRRVLEENYVDDLSPGYVHHDSDLIWLDPELVASRSNDCRRMIKNLPLVPTPDQVEALADRYGGRFALDFEYEEWAAPYRDWLHASFLEIIERALASDLDTGHFARGIHLARRVLDVDPGADQVEVSLLRLYRASGAHAAAAEQYGHYAGVMRDQLGLEPPPLDAL
jgi:DNA-binding SARP family transcriptional activator